MMGALSCRVPYRHARRRPECTGQAHGRELPHLYHVVGYGRPDHAHVQHEDEEVVDQRREGGAGRGHHRERRSDGLWVVGSARA